MKYKTAVLEWQEEFEYVDENGEHINQQAYPSKFVSYEEKCPSCDGAGAIVMHSEDGDYNDNCDYCCGKGYIDCKCGNTAEFITDKRWFCTECLPDEYREAFKKENPLYTFPDESNEDGFVVLDKVDGDQDREMASRRRGDY